MKTNVPLLIVITAALLLLAGSRAAAQPLRAWVSTVDAASFAPNTVVELMLTGTDAGGYTVQRRTMPGPWSDWLHVGPALGLGRQYWMSATPGLVITIYPGDGYIFPLAFIDNARAPMYRARKD